MVKIDAHVSNPRFIGFCTDKRIDGSGGMTIRHFRIRYTVSDYTLYYIRPMYHMFKEKMIVYDDNGKMCFFFTEYYVGKGVERPDYVSNTGQIYVTQQALHFWTRHDVKYGGVICLAHATYSQDWDNPYRDGEKCFDFFDDFEGTSLDTSKWTYALPTGGSISVSNSYLTMSNPDLWGGIKTIKTWDLSGTTGWRVWVKGWSNTLNWGYQFGFGGSTNTADSPNPGPYISIANNAASDAALPYDLLVRTYDATSLWVNQFSYSNVIDGNKDYVQSRHAQGIRINPDGTTTDVGYPISLFTSEVNTDISAYHWVWGVGYVPSSITNSSITSQSVFVQTAETMHIDWVAVGKWMWCPIFGGASWFVVFK